MFSRRPHLRLGDERGTAAIELALCLPLLLALVVGIFQFGWVQHTHSSIRFALEQGARKLVIDPNTPQADVQSFVTSKLAALTNANVTVSLVKTDTANGRVATLSAAYTSNFGIPGVASFSIPYNVTITTAIRSI